MEATSTESRVFCPAARTDIRNRHSPSGQQFENMDISLFASNVVEDGFIRHSDYSTQTLNFNLRVKIDDHQSLYFKAITNWLDARVPTRLTVAQFNTDRRQAGGINDATNAVLLGQRRLDRRTIIGGMYENQLNANTVLTMEADYDVKDINQTFTQISDNINPNYKHYTDLRHDGRLGDMPLRSYVGFFANQMEQEGQTFNNLQDFFGTRGTLAQNSRGTIRNIGGRVREELEFVPKWTLAAGLGFEQSQVSRPNDQLHGRCGKQPGRRRTEFQQLGTGDVVDVETGGALPALGTCIDWVCDSRVRQSDDQSVHGAGRNELRSQATEESQRGDRDGIQAA